MPTLARPLAVPMVPDRESGLLPVEPRARSVARPERRMSAAFARDLRRQSGNTLPDLADAFGVSVSMVRRIEAGEAPLSVEKLMRLAPAGLEFCRDMFDALAIVRRAANDGPSPQLELPGVR